MAAAKALKRLPLNDGHSVPWLAFGTGTALYKQDARKAVLTAIHAGFRHLDGAQLYENEDTLGDAIAESGIPRSEFYVTTKLAKLEGETTVSESLKGSLQKLKLDYVDLFLIHIPTYFESTPTRLQEVWKGMVEAKQLGLTKSIGVSNFTIKQLEQVLSANTEAPAVNQIEYHPWVATKLQPLIDFHKKYRIITASYGGLTPILPDRTGKESLTNDKVILEKTFDSIRSALGGQVSYNQILLKWLEQNDILAVTTSSKESRIKEYLSTEDIPNLSEEAIQAIDSATSPVHFRAFSMFSYMDDL